MVPEGVQRLADIVAVIIITARMYVGGNDCVGDAVFDCHAGHFQGLVQRLRTVIDIREHMAVEVKHIFGFTLLNFEPSGFILVVAKGL